MLLSPGHSPRHISSPSPSISLSEPPTLTNDSNSIATPSVPRRKRPKVLDEDSYVAAIERIIERDFFPDISKLRDRLDWLEAVRTRDPVQIRDAQLKILERRRAVGPNRSTSGASTGTKSQTPGSTFLRSSSFTPFDVDASGQFNGNRGEGHGFDNLDDGTQSADEVDASLSLDEFFRRYTSEDNESFSRILEKVNRKRKERYDYLLEGEKEECVKLIEDAKRERVDTDGYGTSDQPVSTLEGCKYTAKNLLMYHPADRGEVPLTEGERAERLKCLTKEVNKSNTRFRGKMLDYKAKEDDTVEVLYTPVAGSTPLPMIGRDGDKMKRYDLEDLRKTPNNKFYVESGKKAENGYGFVLTPSPGPGADESPFITWGEIEGTPLRLEPEDTPIDIGGSGDGPQFRIPMPPLRDVKAHALSREASRKLKERSRMFQKPPLHSPLRGGSASPNGRTLSPAAQKFVRKAIAKSSHAVDESLRASYRGSSPAAAAAGVSTPKSGRSISRFGSDSNIASRSPSIKEGRNSPW